MTHFGFWNCAQRRPNHPAIVFEDATFLTMGQLLARSNQLAHSMRALGLRAGDVVAVVLENEPAILETYLAIAQLGIFLVPINHHLVAPEISYILKDSEAKMLIASATHAQKSLQAAKEASLPATNCFSTQTFEGLQDYEALLVGKSTDLPKNRQAGSTMNYTSGTTGKPKGVSRPTKNRDPDTTAEQLGMFLMLFGIQPEADEVHICASPLYHTAVLNFASYSLHLGHTVVMLKKWDSKKFLELSDKYKVTHAHMVPTQFHRLLKLKEQERTPYSLKSYRHMIHSAAPCPPDTKRQMVKWWGDCIYEYYAASEGGGTLCSPKDWQLKPGSVGKPWPISDIRIVAEDGSEMPPYEIGTVYMKMGDITFNYHGDAKKTAEAWSQDGYFTVGDAGYVDEDNYLFLCDRKSDMIISGGVNIYPAEIEAAYIQHALVQDVAVFGIPHDDWGEEVKAVIELAQATIEQETLKNELLNFGKDHLAKYKCPKSIDFIPAMPRDPNGKLMKRKLRDPYWEGRESQI